VAECDCLVRAVCYAGLAEECEQVLNEALTSGKELAIRSAPQSMNDKCLECVQRRSSHLIQR
jgi:late competence protein required for DNA uptake (superfamily II DNA/RNA helicase)